MQKILPFLLIFSLHHAWGQSFKVVGYLPHYRFSWIDDIEFERLTHVNISFANPDAAGNLSCEGANIDPAVAKAHQAGCEVFISLAGGYLTPQWETNWNNLTLPANRPAFIQKIIQYVEDHDLDGVDVDLEWQYVESWYSPFVLDLKAALEPLGIPLTVALPGSYRYPQISDPALEAYDWVNMMIYDLTGPWDPSNPGQHSPYGWAQDCVEYWLNQGVPAEKLTLGVPFYGYDFADSPVSSFTYRGIVNENSANAYLDQSGLKFWNGIPTIKAKTQLALDEVAGIMIWEIGADAFGANAQYSLLRAIDEVIAEASVGVAEAGAPSLRIVPNPVRERLRIQWPETIDAELRVIDQSGRQLRRQAVRAESSVELFTGDLVPGLYTLVVYSAAGTSSGRFVKM